MREYMFISIEKQSKREKWRILVEEQEQSGLSQEAFCKQHNLSPTSLVYYRGIFLGKRQTKKSSGSFSSITISKPASTNEIRLALPNGFQCTFSAELEITRLKELVGALMSC